MAGSTIISAQVPAALRDQLRLLAVRHDRSLSREINRAVRLYVAVETRSEDGK